MDIRERVAIAEGRARECRLTINELCSDIGVNRATWQRWKAGSTEPKVSQWDAVEAVLVRHEEAERARQAAKHSVAQAGRAA